MRLLRLDSTEMVTVKIGFKKPKTEIYMLMIISHKILRISRNEEVFWWRLVYILRTS